MANQQSVRDDNRVPGLLIHDSTGAETRQVRGSTANPNAFPVEVVSSGTRITGNASNTDGTSTAVIAAQAAGVRTYITDVTLTNTSATMIYVEMKDGTTVKWTFPVPATGGVTHRFGTALQGTAATAWNFDPSAATTTVYCSAAGYIGA